MDNTENRSGIPLIIGVTGHRDLRAADMEKLKAAVRRELGQLRERCPHTQLKLLCSIAAGADLLCAETAEEAGIPLIAVLPMDTEMYAEDFSPADAERFRRQLERAEEVFVPAAMEAETVEESRDFRYRQAGIYVAEHCHILLALWDGEPDRSGCGTAAAVGFALDGDWLPARGEVTRNGDNTGVIHIPTAQLGSDSGAERETKYLGNRQTLDEILQKTEEFNALAAAAPGNTDGLLPEKAEKDAALERMESLYGAADRLSIRYAGIYKRMMALLAAAGTLMAFFFLLYDEGK